MNDIRYYAQIVAYFALRTPWAAIEAKKAALLVYLADRALIASSHQILIDSPRILMPFGPVNEEIYNLCSGQIINHTWSAIIKQRSDGLITPRDQFNLENDSLDELNVFMVNLLKNVADQYADQSLEDLKRQLLNIKTLPEINDLAEGEVIEPKAIVEAIGMDNPEVVMENIEEYLGIARALNRIATQQI